MKKKYIILIIILIILFYSFPKNNNCYKTNQDIIFQQHIFDNMNNIQDNFKKNKIVLIDDLFQEEYFNELKDNIINYNSTKNLSSNNNFKMFRSAQTVKSSELYNIDIIKNLYYSENFIKFLKIVTNMNLENVSCNDESSMNLLIYNKPKDFISWHFDPNHYKGNRLTILINIINENELSGDLSSSELQYKIDNKIYSIKMKPNSILIFNGSIIEHRATGIAANENRIQLSFTYCDICKETLLGKFIKNIKEIVLGYK